MATTRLWLLRGGVGFMGMEAVEDGEKMRMRMRMMRRDGKMVGASM